MVECLLFIRKDMEEVVANFKVLSESFPEGIEERH
jgi:hypothetical protein